MTSPNIPSTNRKAARAPSLNRANAIVPDPLWKRFTAPHRLAFAYADQLAAQEAAAEVAPEHLLRGMLRLTPDQSNGLRLIESLGVTPEQADARLPQASAAVVWPPQPVASGNGAAARGLSAASGAAVEQSRVIADAMGHDRIGTEHLLIALLGQSDSAVSQALVPCGVTQAACRERLGAWLVNGTYKREQDASVSATAVSPQSEQALQTILAVRRWAQIVYLVWVLGTWLTGANLPGGMGVWLRVLSAVTVYPLFYFIVPYILSTYGLNYLLRSRYSQGLAAMPPSKSMVGLAVPFTISALLGVGMVLGAVPYIGGLLGLHVAGVGFSGLPGSIVALQWAFLVNCLALIATHWLLMFNVR